MKWLLSLVVAIFVMGNDGLAQTIQFTDTQSRSWSDSSGQNTLTGRLVSRDPAKGTLQVEYDDATRLEIALADLSISDRRYVARQTSRMQREAKRLTQANRLQGEDAASEDAVLKTRRPANGESPVPGTQRLYNIDWHRQADSAQLAAAGREGGKDDKPILWFRVLGDLDGYM